MSSPDPKDLDAFQHHWQDEADAAFLYRALANAEGDAAKQDLYRRLAAVEDRHVTIWSDLLTRRRAGSQALRPVRAGAASRVPGTHLRPALPPANAAGRGRP